MPPTDRSSRCLRYFASGAVVFAALHIAGCDDDSPEVAQEVPEYYDGENDADIVTPTTTTPVASRGDDLVATRTDADADAQRYALQTTSWTVSDSLDGDDSLTEIDIVGVDGDSSLTLFRRQPSTVRAGETLRYDLVAENRGDKMLRNIVISEWRSGGLEVDRSGMADQSGNSANNNASDDNASESAGNAHDSWTIESLRPGESARIEVVGIAPEEGTVSTCLHVSYEPTMCFTTQVVKPEIMLERRISDDVAMICDDIQVVYVVSNVGTAVASDLELHEPLPEGLTSGTSDAITIPIDSIAPGEIVEFAATIRADEPGVYASSAVLRGGRGEVRSRESEIAFIRPELELQLDAPSREYVGRTVPLRLVLSNNGDGPALDTVVALPGLERLEMTSLSTSNAMIDGSMITVGRIGPGESREMVLNFLAADAATVDLTARAEAYCAEVVEDDVSINLVGVEAVRVEMIDLVDPVTVGDRTTYDIQVKNQGTADSINVRLVAELPSEMTFVEGRGDSEVSSDGGLINFAAIPRLGPTEVASWRVTVEAGSAAKTQMKLELTSDATKRPVVEHEPTTIIEEAVYRGASR